MGSQNCVLQQNNRRVEFTDMDVSMEASDMGSDSQIQRVWAYLTVKQLLEKE